MNLVFGALAAPLYRQLHLPRRRLRHLQACADSITTLMIGQVLSDGEAHRARRRLVKRIQQTLFNGKDKA